MKDVLKLIVAILIVIIAWKVLKGLIGLAVGMIIAGLVVYAVMKLVDGSARGRAQ